MVAFNDGMRLGFKVADIGVTGFSFAAAQADPAVKDLGFNAAQASKGPLVGDSLDQFALQVGDAHFTLTVGTDSYQVTLPLVDANGDLTNDSIDDLVADVNAALPAALAGTRSSPPRPARRWCCGSRMRSLTEVGFKAAIDDAAVFELGLHRRGDDHASRASRRSRICAVVVGRLASDTTLTLTPPAAAVPRAPSRCSPTTRRRNTTILSLVNDLNKVLATPTLKSGVLDSFAFASDVSFDVSVDGVAFSARDRRRTWPTTSRSPIWSTDINDALDDAGLGATVKAKSSGASSAPGNARVKFEGTASGADKVSTSSRSRGNRD